MAGLDALAGVGGATPDDSQPSSGSWTDLLANQQARNALLSASLHLMTGGWGNGVQQLGQALGAGAESASNTAKAQEAEGVRQSESAQKAQLEREGFASHEKVAGITGESREAAATIRAQASIERAHLALQKAPASVAVKYLDQARKIVEGNLQNINIDDLTKTQMIREKAALLYQSDLDRGWITGSGMPSGEPPTEGKGPAPGTLDATGTSTNAPGTGGTGPGGTTVPAKKPGASGEGGPEPGKPSWAFAIQDPRVKKLLETPEGRAQVLKVRPDFKRYIDKYESTPDLGNQ